MAFNIIYNIASGYSYIINMAYIQYSRSGSCDDSRAPARGASWAKPSTRVHGHAIIRIWLKIIIIIHVRIIFSAVRLQHGIQFHYNIASGYSYIITMAYIQYRPLQRRVQRRLSGAFSDGWSAVGPHFCDTDPRKYHMYVPLTFMIKN